MTMTTIATLPLCECCVIALANADTSGCEYYCGDDHAARLCGFGLEPGEDVVVADASEDINGYGGMIRCAGCGDDAMHAGDAAILARV